MTCNCGSFFCCIFGNNLFVLFVLCVLLLILIGSGWWWTHRNRYWLVETKNTGTVKPRIVQLPLKHIEHAKLRHEIKIFNRLYLVLPTVYGVALAYREQMRALLRNPQHRPGTDPYERLFYGYACEVLRQKIPDEVVQRQLRRNLIFLLAPKRKIVKKRSVVWSRQKYQLHAMPVYKIFQDSYLDPLQPAITAATPWQIVVHGSYIKYYNQDIVVKRYAHAYTLDARNLQTVTLQIAPDKSDFDCQINRGVVTCRHLPSGESHTYTVRGEQVRLATSLCGKTDALEIYLTWQGQAKIYLDGGQPQSLTSAEINTNQRLEQIVTAAYQAKFITGERLRARYLAATKLVPSLESLTRVIAVQGVDDFLQAWAMLDDYRQIARIFQGFNLVFLYSSATPQIADTITATITAECVTACHQDQLWLYFIDRTVTEPDALYFLTKLSRPNHYVPPAPTPPGLTMTRNWPYVKTLTVTNTLPQKMTRDLVVPLRFNHISVVSANGSILTVTELQSGRTSTYVLPTPLHLSGEWLTTHVNVSLHVKLAGYETRQFNITRREKQNQVRLTKKDLATAISEIQIHTDDKKLDAVFTKNVVDGEDLALLSAVKAAFQNQNRKLLFTAMGDRYQITADVWQYLLTQIVGLRVRGGKIYLTPCMNLMGEFTLSFLCAGRQYAFNTKKNLSKSPNFAIIKYGNSK